MYIVPTGVPKLNTDVTDCLHIKVILTLYHPPPQCIRRAEVIWAQQKQYGQTDSIKCILCIQKLRKHIKMLKKDATAQWITLFTVIFG